MSEEQKDEEKPASRKDQKRAKRLEREQNRSSTSRVLRAIFVPVSPWRSPVRSASTSGLPNEIGALRRGISARRNCPKCNGTLSVGDVVAQDADGQPQDGSYRAFMCQGCGWHESVADALAEAKHSLDGFKSAAFQLLIFGIGIFGTFGVISIFNGSIFTFLGGAVIGFSLLCFSLFYRYRHWQVVHERLFESHPPIKDWLKDEMTR